MSVEEENTDMNFRPTKHKGLKVATGGRGEPPDAFNWLEGTEVGTIFTTHVRGSLEPDLELYKVLFKSLPGVVLLQWTHPDGRLIDRYVDPRLFSKRYEPPTLLGIEEEPDIQAEGEENGNGNRAD